MSRKPKRGYFVAGQFVAEGSELDQQLQAERNAGGPSRTARKHESERLQKLGEALLTLRLGLLEPLNLPESLTDALDEARRITDFEGRRRQMQYVGKLMRALDADTLAAIEAAVQTQHTGSAAQTLTLHEAERWRDALIERDGALGEWLQAHPDTDVQQLRALVRQARKDGAPDAAAVSRGMAPRRGRAYRELFQIVRERLGAGPT